MAITPEVEERLCRAADEVALKAYAPYSHFRVGCAVVGASGRIHIGANVENASYGAALCAERSALSTALAEADGGFTALALAFPDVSPGAPATSLVPCGICRQWLAELAPGIEILVCGHGLRFTIEDLLPTPFVLP